MAERHQLTRIPQTAYYIAFGAHGPRALPPPGEGWKVAGYTAVGILASFLLFVGIRMGAKGTPSTMNKEYQEATNEYLKVWNLLPTYIHIFLSIFCGVWELRFPV
jgi:cytochrome c oxidase subunit 4